MSDLKLSMSIASVRQFSTVSFTRGWSGGSMGPWWLSWHASWAGKTAASKSSDRMRWIATGTFLPPLRLGSAKERVAFQRQRLVNMGDWSADWSMSFLREARRAKPKIDSIGKLCWDESESTMPSSVAAAWSSKSNVRQNRFLSVCPHARLMRPPKGEWMTICMPPASSKNRSATISPCVGTRPSTRTVSRT